MELILVPGDVSRLQSRNTAFRRNLKYSAIERRLLLVKISEFNGEALMARMRTLVSSEVCASCNRTEPEIFPVATA